jgi:hypothetical protein
MGPARTLSRKTLALGLLSLLAGGMIASAAAAQTPAPAQHPRQAEVLARDAHQRAVIRAERREGDLTRAKAHRLLAVDRRIARRVHVLARAHGGRIIAREQRVLNHEENRLAQRIPS